MFTCLTTCMRGGGVCKSACVVVAQSLGGCSAAVDACSSDSIVSVSKDLPAALFHHLFIMLIHRTNETREEGGRRLCKHGAGVIFPLLSPSFLSLSPFPAPLSSHPCALFICRVLIARLTSLIIPLNIVFIITHNNDSRPSRRNVRRAQRIFHR